MSATDVATPKTVTPTARYDLRDGAIQVQCFGRPKDWSLQNYLATPVAEQPPLVRLFEDAVVSKVYAPNASTFNARVVPRAEIDPIWVSGNPSLRAEALRDSERIISERTILKLQRLYPPADGMVLEPDEGFFLSSGDCPTIIAYCEGAGHVIAAHAGRDCLWDRAHILTGEKSRAHASVVDSIMEHFAYWRDQLRVFVCCGIGEEYFTHPTMAGENITDQQARDNHRMFAYFRRLGNLCATDLALGKLSLFRIIRAKFADWGVSSDRVVSDGVDTYSDTSPSDDYKYWSNRRFVNGKSAPGEPNGRNGILVIRRR